MELYGEDNALYSIPMASSSGEARPVDNALYMHVGRSCRSADGGGSVAVYGADSALYAVPMEDGGGETDATYGGDSSLYSVSMEAGGDGVYGGDNALYTVAVGATCPAPLGDGTGDNAVVALAPQDSYAGYATAEPVRPRYYEAMSVAVKDSHGHGGREGTQVFPGSRSNEEYLDVEPGK